MESLKEKTLEVTGGAGSLTYILGLGLSSDPLLTTSSVMFGFSSGARGESILNFAGKVLAIGVFLAILITIAPNFAPSFIVEIATAGGVTFFETAMLTTLAWGSVASISYACGRAYNHFSK